jgi:hypothetical protein
MIAAATGAEASAPRPPPFTTTPTAICGLAIGANPVKTASSRPVLLAPFCAVPVFPATVIPPRLATMLCAVPYGWATTSAIILLTSAATVGLTVWLSSLGRVITSVLRFGAITFCTR